MLLNLTEGAAQADWYYVNIFEPNDDTQNYGSGQLTADGSRHLTPAPSEAAEKEEQPELAPSAISAELSETTGSAVSADTFVALNVFPVPVKTGHPIFIHYALNNSADFTVELMDAKGSVISAMTQSGQVPGTYTMTLSTPEQMASGIYFLKLNAGKESITRKVIVE
jgi:hypothetical protein